MAVLALAMLLGLPAGVATAARAPGVTTLPASGISQTAATLNGNINPNGFAVSTCQFEWGATPSYGNTVPCAQATATIGPGATPVSATLSGLLPNTTYYFELVFNGTFLGAPGQSFTTLPPPTVVTGAASAISQTAATLNGTVNPNGGAITSCQFDWGTTTSYGSVTPCAQAVGSGTSPVPVSAALSGLSPNTTYYFNLVVTYAGATSAGTGNSFTTVPQPTVVTGAASAISQTAATLNGTVNPNGSAVTSCQFDWGTTTSYGRVTPCAQAVGSGTSPVPVSAALTGLSPNTTYHFRVVATYAGGTSDGADQTFAAGSPPSVSPSPPEVKSSTESAFSGMVNPNGSSTAAHFEYGLDPRYTPGGPVVYDQTTPVQQVGSDDVEHSVTATATELVPNALYHVRLVATNGAGTVVGPDQTFMTAKDPMPPPPVLGKTFNAVPVSGLVFVKPPPGKSLGKAVDAAVHGLVKGHGFVPLTEARQLPSGSEIDARAGSLDLATAPPVRRGKLQTGVFGGGLFQTVQTRTGLEKGLTTLQLLYGIFKGAPTFGSCKTHAAGDTASQAGVSPTVLQTLHAHDKHGKWRTRGHNSSATVRGTVWDTVDRCDGTLTVVHRGTVNVFDFGRRKTIVVHAHHQYLAKAVRAKPR